MNLPHIVSRVNGMKIPFLQGTAEIMHRYEIPENRLVVESVHPNGVVAKEPEMLVSASTKEGADLTPRKPKTVPAGEVAL